MTSTTSKIRPLQIVNTVVALLATADADAGLPTPPPANTTYSNGLGIGLSYGEQVDRDADFWGWTADYSRYLNSAWIAGLSLTWDEETERFIDRPDKTVRTYALIGTISYNLTPRFSLTTGLAQDIADDDNATGTMKFKSGNVSTGLSLGYTWLLSKRNSIGASLAYEYNISENETSVSIDISIGWNF